VTRATRKRIALVGCAVFAVLSFGVAHQGGMPWWAGAFWIVCFLALLVAGSRRLVDEVELTDLGVTRRFGAWLGRKREERVLWDELARVEILTTDRQGFFFLLEGRDGAGVAVSNELAGKHELVAVLQRRLPGFDGKAIIEASRSTTRRRFLVWQIQNENDAGR
jgi:hypothetical protein